MDKQRNEFDEAVTRKGDVDFWGEKNEDKQALSMDWSHECHFWIALTSDNVEDVLAVVRQLLSEKLGGDWPERPSSRAKGRYFEVKRNHYLFAEYGRTDVKNRFAEVHPTETGMAIFVRFWQDMFEDAKAAFEARGFQYHPQIPKKYRVKVPGSEISPEKAAVLEKFRSSQPLEVPETMFERSRSKKSTVIGLVVFLFCVVAALVMLRSHLVQLFIRVEPLDLGTFLAAKSNVAVYEKVDGSIVYALASADIDDKMNSQVLIYGDQVDSSRFDFYAIRGINDQQGSVLYQAFEGSDVSLPTFLEGQELAKFRLIDTKNFRHDRKKDWEDLEGELVALKGQLQREPDGYYLKAGDGLVQLTSTSQFMLLNIQIAQEKGKPVTLYGTVGETFDWTTVRKESRKMFRFSVEPVTYATLTAP